MAGSFVVSFGLPSPRAGRWVIAGIAKLHQWGGSEGRRAAQQARRFATRHAWSLAGGEGSGTLGTRDI